MPDKLYLMFLYFSCFLYLNRELTFVADELHGVTNDAVQLRWTQSSVDAVVHEVVHKDGAVSVNKNVLSYGRQTSVSGVLEERIGGKI